MGRPATSCKGCIQPCISCTKLRTCNLISHNLVIRASCIFVLALDISNEPDIIIIVLLMMSYHDSPLEGKPGRTDGS